MMSVSDDCELFMFYSNNFFCSNIFQFLHYAFYPSRASISGTRTNFTRTRTTFSEGPSTGQIWYGKVIYTVKFYPSRATFFGTRTIFIRAVPKISWAYKVLPMPLYLTGI